MKTTAEEKKMLSDHLRRVAGQIEAIDRMISDGRTCVDVLQQLRAAKASLTSIEKHLATSELLGCLPVDQEAGKVEKLVGTLLD